MDFAVPKLTFYFVYLVPAFLLYVDIVHLINTLLFVKYSIT